MRTPWVLPVEQKLLEEDMSSVKNNGGNRKRTKFRVQKELLLQRDDLRESLMFHCRSASKCTKNCSYRVLNELVDAIETLRNMRDKRFQGVARYIFLCVKWFFFLLLVSTGIFPPIKIFHPGVLFFAFCCELLARVEVVVSTYKEMLLLRFA